jgi:hypothetical protein
MTGHGPNGDPRLTHGVRVVMAAIEALPHREDLTGESEILDRAEARGYFEPEEDERIRAVYAQYLSVRSGLLMALSSLEPMAGCRECDWEERFDAFLVAFAAACLLVDAGGWLVDFASTRPVLWKKLDEAECRYGIPRKTFTQLYRAGASARRMAKFSAALAFHRSHRPAAAARAGDPLLGPVVAWLNEREARLPKRRDLARRVMGYRMFVCVRHPHSACKRVMFGLMRAAGRAVAELHQPGVKAPGEPKRVGGAERRWLLERLRPGDFLISRHDDAVTNLFLPGFWPHTILHIGTAEERRRLGVRHSPGHKARSAGPVRFLEAKKDGVLFRPPEDSLAVDVLAALRPPLAAPDLAEALSRAITHEGKLYDFVFDFTKADRLVCSEVVYRGFHGIGGLSFRLVEHSGRRCLPTGELARQALALGFEVLATVNLGEPGVREGSEAREGLVASLERGKELS